MVHDSRALGEALETSHVGVELVAHGAVDRARVYQVLRLGAGWAPAGHRG